MRNYSIKVERAAAEAYVELLKTKESDKITVKDIVEKSGISRQTFYYHFESMMELAEYTFMSILENTAKKCSKTEDPKEAIRIVLETVQNNMKMLINLEKSTRAHELERRVAQAIQTMMLNVLEKTQPDKIDLPKKDVEYMLSFYSYGTLGTVLCSIEDGTFDIEKMTEQNYRMFCGEYPLF